MAEAFDLVCKPLSDTATSEFLRSFGNCDLERGPWIAGGSIRKIWYGLPWRRQDVDWFFPDEQSFNIFKSGMDKRSLTSISLDRALEYIKINSNTLVDCYSTNNAETYTNNGDDGWKVQAIRKYFPANLEELFSSFDFTVCQFATDGKTLVATREAIRDCDARVINIVENTTRNITVLRTMKYAAYGFTPTDGSMKQMLRALAENQALMEEADEY